MFLLLTTLQALAGCASPRLYFRPSGESDRGREPGALPVSSIPLVDGAGHRRGTLCLGAQGVYEIALSPGEPRRRVLHIELLVVNEGDEPLSVEMNAQRVTAIDGLPLMLPAQLRAQGEVAESLTVAPGQTADADLFFEVDTSTSSPVPEGFELAWRVTSARAAFQGWSEFVSIAPSDNAYPRQSYRGVWKGYFFPGCDSIPGWGRELFFAPFEGPPPTVIDALPRAPAHLDDATPLK